MRVTQRAIRRIRSGATAVALTGLVAAAGITGAAPAADAAKAAAQPVAGPRIDLRVLVVADGSGTTSAISDALTTAGVPITTVTLGAAGRAPITAGFLADTLNGSPRAKFEAVVLPNENPFGDPAEMSALVAYEKQFGIRQVNAYSFPSASIGLNFPTYLGTLDGVTATASTTGAFRYLDGPVAFADASPAVSESYGYVATPLAGAPFTPVLTAPAPDGSGSGTLAGIYTADGRSQLSLTFAYSTAQQQFRLLAHGLITWMTKGVHLGYERNYFSVHVDDVFGDNSRWLPDQNCTNGDVNCGQDASQIRMTPADVSALAAWQAKSGMTLDLYFNAFGSADAIKQNGSDPLTTAFLKQKSQFRFANHTWSHKFLGCQQDHTVTPWKCTLDANGNVQYVSAADISAEIKQNVTWASRNGVSIQSNELVTGEHSGLFILPQQTQDSPNLISALNSNNIAWVGSDASRDKQQRKVGPALTVPRYPINFFFNVANTAEEIDEYNWIYTSRADGGSGICEDNPLTVTCIAPLGADGLTSTIMPTETRIAMSHIVSNDPRPHYVHQANISESRILYPLLDNILGTYNTAFADNTPLVNQRMAENGAELARQSAWKAAVAANKVSAYVQDGKVTVSAPNGLDVPLTLPNNTVQATYLQIGNWQIQIGASLFGSAYAGERSAYVRFAAGTTSTFTLSGSAGV
ncbi:MAG: hypothetical protein JWO79_2194 [Actinomycetia bacterium]|nr:hypothetical protein [Actinomycetes bacterium]